MPGEPRGLSQGQGHHSSIITTGKKKWSGLSDINLIYYHRSASDNEHLKPKMLKHLTPTPLFFLGFTPSSSPSSPVLLDSQVLSLSEAAAPRAVTIFTLGGLWADFIA